MVISKKQVLENLTIGSRVAEDESEALASYFVETDQWRQVAGGAVDVVFGAKGAGKSAIYSSLINRTDMMFDSGIVFVSAENPRGTPAFRDLVSDPPTSEQEFVGLWKLYVLSLLARVFDEYAIDSADAREVTDALTSVGLRPENASLRTIVRNVLDYVRTHLNPESIEGEVRLDPGTGLPVVRGKISLREPGAAEKAAGTVSADALFEAADRALLGAALSVWVLFDRLDVAFADTRALEANALRSLFKVYLDTMPLTQIDFRIFLRSDIWSAVTEGGFREASHITRKLEIEWNPAALLNLLVRRLLRNPDLVAFYGVDPEAVLASAEMQRSFFARLVPERIDSGRNPLTFEWMLGRVRDGTGSVAPRELIHLMTAARDVQLRMLERGEPEPPEENLFSRQAFRDALPEVSRVRLEQTLYAEYPDLKPALTALEEQKTNHSIESLAAIWQVGRDEAERVAAQLVSVGFFERRGPKAAPDYWVPFLYRPALRMIQGSADDGADSSSVGSGAGQAATSD